MSTVISDHSAGEAGSRPQESQRAELPGLAARPLNRYLATLGLFKIVSRQLDPGIRLGWSGDRPFFERGPKTDTIIQFMLDDYSPTPLVAPWNGGTNGGFRPGSSDAFASLISKVRETTTPRLHPMREVFAVTAEIVAGARWAAASDKREQVQLLRNQLPDAAIEFLDASVALTTDALKFPPLMGTGGNIGRLDLVRNYWTYLLDVMSITAPKRGATTPEALLRQALIGAPARLVTGTPGQFDSKGAGGANESRTGPATALVNPWMYILAMEGALLFAASSSRRLGWQRTAVAAPFTVGVTQVGYASSTPAEAATYEFWAPLWSSPATLDATAGVLAEGRATWSGAPAQNGVDFLRAMRSLGVDRGLDGFARYAFLERNGQSKVAVPLGIHRVTDDQGVRLTADLDSWIKRLRSAASNSAAVRSAAHRVEAALFATAECAGPAALSTLLYECSEAELALGRSRSARESGIPPIPMLSAKRWLLPIAQATTEFRLALAIASGFHARTSSSRSPENDGRNQRAARCSSWAEYLRPVIRHKSWFEWSERGPLIAGFGTRPIVGVLADCLVLRASSEPAPRRNDPDARSLRTGQSPHDRFLQFESRFAAPASDVEALATGAFDAIALQQWVQALCLLTDFRYIPRELKDAIDDRLATRPSAGQSARPGSVSPIWQLVAPWFGAIVPANDRSDARRRDGIAISDGVVYADNVISADNGEDHEVAGNPYPGDGPAAKPAISSADATEGDTASRARANDRALRRSVTPRSWPSLLVAGRLREVSAQATEKARRYGSMRASRGAADFAVDDPVAGPAIAAACLVPTRKSELAHLAGYGPPAGSRPADRQISPKQSADEQAQPSLDRTTTHQTNSQQQPSDKEN